MIKVKRAYQPAAAEDGFRVLVERLWPRGLSKAEVALDLWLKEVAPSPELAQMVRPRSPKMGGVLPALLGPSWLTKARPSGCSGKKDETATSPWSTAPGTRPTTPRWP